VMSHQQEENFADPDSFRPQRFLPERSGTEAPSLHVWIPFGGGVRRCLGASFAQFEMKVVLRELVSRLDLRAARPQQEARVRRAIVFAPSRGGEVVARGR
jgi:cytochrome P450